MELLQHVFSSPVALTVTQPTESRISEEELEYFT